MQFFYQFPQRTSGSRSSRAAASATRSARCCAAPRCPGVGAAGARRPRTARARRAGRAAGERLRERGNSKGVYLQAIARALRPLEQPGAREAFLHTLRSVIDVRGQRVSARDRLYLLARMPTLIVWGERDNTIPLEHGRAAHEAIPHSRFETLPRAAHFPHLEDPEGLAQRARRRLCAARRRS
jgi:pimeloyl-ACP methyl ester carboxylesterase